MKNCEDCGTLLDDDFCCPSCDYEDTDIYEDEDDGYGDDYDDRDYEDYDGFRDDVDADSDVLRMAGYGTDEDYGFYDEVY